MRVRWISRYDDKAGSCGHRSLDGCILVMLYLYLELNAVINIHRTNFLRNQFGAIVNQRKFGASRHVQ